MNISRVLHDGDFGMCDPGDRETLHTRSRSLVQFAIVTSAAETRTLPAPERAGLFVGVNLMVDGGGLTLDVVGGFNQADDAQVVFADGGSIMLYSIAVTPKTFRWRVLSSDGVTLQ